MRTDLSHVPKTEETSDNAFYLPALPKVNGQIWYHKKGAGKETLGNVVKIIMKKRGGGLKGIQITPCGVVACATRLYDAGIDEQLVIPETTGHRSSVGVKAYKCTVVA